MAIDQSKAKTEYIALLRAGHGRLRAAREIRVSPSTIHRWRNADPEFDAACQEAEEEASEPIEYALYQAACRGEPWAVQMWLRHRAKDRWGETPTLRIQQVPSDEELAYLIALFQEDINVELPEPDRPELPDASTNRD